MSEELDKILEEMSQKEPRASWYLRSLADKIHSIIEATEECDFSKLMEHGIDFGRYLHTIFPVVRNPENKRMLYKIEDRVIAEVANMVREKCCCK